MPNTTAPQVLPTCLTQSAEHDFLLQVHIQPAAKTSEIVGLHGHALKVRIACPPVDGKANLALCAFMAAQLNCHKSVIRLMRGSSSRQKTLHMQLDANQLKTLLHWIK